MTDQGPNQSTQGAPPPMALLEMILGYWVSRAIHAAARLGIAGHLREGPLDVERLAACTGAEPQCLHRLLRALASVGIFAEQEPNLFRLTPLGECLQQDVPHSMKAAGIFYCEDFHWRPWGELLHAVKTGNSAFEHVFGMKSYRYYAENPEAARLFQQTMTTISVMEDVAIAEAYDFDSFPSVVDVGGGHGRLLVSILKSNPGPRGILFEAPHVIEAARAFIRAEGVEDRCELVAGDCLGSITAREGGLYILKHVIHSFDDDVTVKILENCRAAMSDGKLLVIEMVIPPGNAPHFSKLLDLEMMVMTDGRERTEPEFRSLFERAGLRLSKVVGLQPMPISLIEGVGAGGRM